ncbi:hypothetical protein BDR26DRAFT_1010003 [Obelidium mucronatum]|nr:hypothetical protein BDR26DRAFT_1010003 [Obelidium mucronatum]
MKLLAALLVLLLAAAAAHARDVRRRFPLRLAGDTLRAFVDGPLGAATAASHGETLAPLLVARVAGSDANAAVRRRLGAALRGLGWHVAEDAFDADTPLGKKHFANIVATKNPRAKQRLVLAAHFDSKYFKDEVFLGATDSAVPCAIMLEIAKSLNNLLEQQDPSSSKTLQLIFFDGEEAFVDWTQTDSVYGSRHLAEQWEKVALDGSAVASTAGKRASGSPKKKNVLKSIDALVLLDLLGDPTSTFVNLNTKTSWMWDRLVDIETRLAQLQLLSPSKSDAVNLDKKPAYFVPGPNHMGAYAIDDDHRPFRDRGVPIVHVIAVPFPRTWHTIKDDGDHVSSETGLDLTRIFSVLVAEYLGLLGEYHTEL